MKKSIIVILIILLTGCSYQELNNLSIVKYASIDIENNLYVLNCGIKEYKDNKENITVLEGTGRTVAEAIDNINSSKKLYTGHLELYIISDSIAKTGIVDVLDYFFRNSMSKKTFQIVIAKKTSAKNILKEILINDSIEKESLVSTTLLSFIKKLKEPGIESIVNGISLVDNKIKVNDLALFKEDKLIKWQESNDEVLLLLNQKNNQKVTVNCKNGNVVFYISNISIKKYFKIDNKIHFKYRITSKSNIDEMTCNYDATKIKDIEILENLLINNLKTELTKVTEEMYLNKIDYLGIGNFIYQNDYNSWVNLKNNYLNNLEIEFEIFPNLLKEKNTSKGVKINEQND